MYLRTCRFAPVVTSANELAFSSRPRSSVSLSPAPFFFFYSAFDSDWESIKTLSWRFFFQVFARRAVMKMNLRGIFTIGREGAGRGGRKNVRGWIYAGLRKSDGLPVLGFFFVDDVISFIWKMGKFRRYDSINFHYKTVAFIQPLFFTYKTSILPTKKKKLLHRALRRLTTANYLEKKKPKFKQ